MAETNEYWQSITTQEALEQRLWEKRVIWYDGEINVYNLWMEGDQCYLSGASEFGFIFKRPIPVDSWMAIKLK